MGDFLKYLQDREGRLKSLTGGKKNINRAMAILILSMGVFFYPNSTKISIAEGVRTQSAITLAEMVPEKKLGNFVYKNSQERTLPARLAEDASKRAGKAGKLPNKTDNSYAAESAKKEIIIARLGEKEVVAMVAGHPIEEMAPYISKREKKVASFLVAIAKKESNWGVYSPKKSGRECYNYWGYKGAYNLTDSGYSCFDSPEQAIKVVGDKIESLLVQQVNTPSRMVVWKCGRSCAGHDPAGVAKWISDVALYYGKLNS